MIAARSQGRSRGPKLAARRWTQVAGIVAAVALAGVARRAPASAEAADSPAGGPRAGVGMGGGGGGGARATGGRDGDGARGAGGGIAGQIPADPSEARAGGRFGGAGGAAGAAGLPGAGGTPSSNGGATAFEPDAVSAPVSPVPPPQVPLRLRVLEKGTRRPLGGAAISIDARPAGETDADGRLVVSLAPGSHQVEAQFPGHAASRDAVEIVDGRDDEIIARLAPQTDGERYETVVRSSRKEVPAVSIDAQEAKQVAGTSGDPVRVLASLPGVSQVVWPAAIFVVRGSNPGNTGFFIDGIRVPAIFHLALAPSIIAPDLLGGMDFYPGAYPANFGRYISGVVSIRSERPPEDRVHVYGDVSFYEARAVVTAPVDAGRGVVAAAARYSYTRPLLSVFDPNLTVDYSDYQLRFDHALGGGQATIFAFGSLDRLDSTDAPFQNMPSLGGNTHTAALQFHRLDFRWAGAVLGGRLTAGVTGGYDTAKSSLLQALLSVQAVDVAPRLVWIRRLGPSFDLEAGGDAEYQHFSAQPVEQFAGKPSDIGRSRPALSQGTFATVRIHVGDRLILAPGLRGDLFAEEGTSRFVLEPRLDVKAEVSSRIGLRLNLGRFSQMPSLPLNVAGFESFGLKSIGLQRSDAISGGIDARAFDDTAIEVIGFYQRMRVTDVSLLDPQTGKITSEDYLILHDGVGYGVEAMIRRPITHRLSGWVNYTLSYSLRNGSNGVVRSDWDQRHLLNLVGAYRVSGATTLSARFHYNSGREVAMPPTTIRSQLPGYYQVDLRAERSFVFDRFILGVFADIANATFNRELVQYVATTAGPMPSYLRLVLPTLGVRGAF